MIALEQALAIVEAQETWSVQDDLCDCTYQRIGYWYNPYIGETLETRLCCVWAEFEKVWPQFFRRVQHEPAAWNGEDDMPRAVWNRQLAAKFGRPLADIREDYANTEPTKGQPRKEALVLWVISPWGEVPLKLG